MIDVIMLSYDEPNADANFRKLAEICPWAMRVKGVKGIQNAHEAVADTAHTEQFYVIDGDNEVLEDFDFDAPLPDWYKKFIHVWRSRNAVNGLEYGNGGVKLMTKSLVTKLDKTLPDYTTSVQGLNHFHDEVASINRFNSDPFRAWRAAFRECAKLSAKVISGSIDAETEQRLTIWQTCGLTEEFGQFALDGAAFGAEYGGLYRGDLKKMVKINDFNWLKTQFKKQHPGIFV